ncbi:hypothetical protein [Winogradskyella pulchriflava]|uniref:Uncharacterized protein n=1 Tax=Winogradskyella pulchriflava TaxID=1110688 RepID=A0ABV6QC97_9FLAO
MDKIKTTMSGETSEKIKKCFLTKLTVFEKQNSDFLKENNIELDNIFILFNSVNYIEYKFREVFNKLEPEFQKDAEFFFKDALQGCLDKYSE